MLRLLVLLLLLANGGYYAWSHGYLLSWGVGPMQQSEPHRIAQQLRPEAVRILRSEEVRRLEAAAAATARPPECLAAGPLDDATVSALRPVLESWPAGSWNLEPATEPARWIVYMGKYLTLDHVNRKKAELRQLGISYENLANPGLEPGLSLGGFPTEAEAGRHLENLAQRGVRTARVAQERAEQRGQRLALPAVDDALRPRVEEIRGMLGGRPLRACR
ncbi:SPOR domain-containing protein [Ramlibacter sp.]|uniref:SPOR domain-containing protein n=1 Tax=Ramlibacter sp. TaxID=1917967 RepID=UPI003D13211C